MRAKFRATLKKSGLLRQVPSAVWQQDWVVDCRPVGSGETALKYLAPYVFRVALSNNRILKAEQGQVTFRYRAGDTGRWCTKTLSAAAFIQRFLQHVLPKGFVKVRYYGLLAPGNRARLRQAQALLEADRAGRDLAPDGSVKIAAAPPPTAPPPTACPQCGQPMRVVQHIQPRARCPP